MSLEDRTLATRRRGGPASRGDREWGHVRHDNPAVVVAADPGFIEALICPKVDPRVAAGDWVDPGLAEQPSPYDAVLRSGTPMERTGPVRHGGSQGGRSRRAGVGCTVISRSTLSVP